VPNKNPIDLKLVYKRIIRYKEVINKVNEAKLLELKAVRLYKLSLK